MVGFFSGLISRFAALPPYGIGGLVVILLYAVQSEIRFGSRARTMRAGATDRSSTLAVSISTAIPILGFAIAMKVNSPGLSSWVPHWFAQAVVPGLPFVAWAGVGLGVLGLVIRLVAEFHAARALHQNATGPKRALDRAPRTLPLGSSSGLSRFPPLP